MKVYERIAQAFKGEGVSHIFGMMGDGNMYWWDALDKLGGVNLWEGRAEVATTDRSPLADRTRNAQALAAALFRDFPGRSGETVQVRATE